jgi:hypothetical protein
MESFSCVVQLRALKAAGYDVRLSVPGAEHMTDEQYAEGGSPWALHFDVMLERLKAFRQRYGDTLVPPKWNQDPELSSWVSMIRVCHLFTKPRGGRRASGSAPRAHFLLDALTHCCASKLNGADVVRVGVLWLSVCCKRLTWQTLRHIHLRHVNASLYPLQRLPYPSANVALAPLQRFP